MELEWLPATDILLVTHLTLSTSGGTYELSRMSGAFQVDGNRLRFQMPLLTASDVGQARISVTGDKHYGLFEGGPTRCEGFAECRFHCWVRDVPWFVSVTVQAGG